MPTAIKDNITKLRRYNLRMKHKGIIFFYLNGPRARSRHHAPPPCARSNREVLQQFGHKSKMGIQPHKTPPSSSCNRPMS